MSEHKSHKIKVSNLPKTKPICNVNNKPFVALLLVWIFVVIVYVTSDLKIFTLPFAIYGLIIAFRPYRDIFSGSNSFFVIFSKESKEDACIYYLSDLKSWTYHKNFLNPSINFILNDGEEVVLDRSVDSDICDYFRKVAAKKEIKKK